MKKVIPFFTALLCLFIISCQKNVPLENKESEGIVLGNRKENPFSIKNYRGADKESVAPNFYYYKLRTNNLEKLKELIEEGQELSDIPLDYEIVQGGSFYEENVPEDNFTKWYYLMTTVEQYRNLDSSFQTVILDEMYVPQSIIDDFENDTESVYEDCLNENSRIAWFDYAKCKPYGTVQVWDEVREEYVPVPNVKVRVSQWCFFKETTTDENGNFRINANFSTVLQNTLHFKVYFENKNDSVFLSGSPIVSYYIPSDKNIRGFKGCDIKIKKDSDAQFPRILLAASKYREYAQKDGIPVREELKFWCNNSVSTGVTLMRDVIKVHLDLPSVLLGMICGGPVGAITGDLIATALAMYAPDVFVGTAAGEYSTSTENIYELVFHEMSHVSHFTGLGKNQIDYWGKEYFEQIDAWISVRSDGRDPFEDCYNGGKNEVLNHVESWGYFYGFYLNYRYYSELAEKDSLNEIIYNSIEVLKEYYFNVLDINQFRDDSVNGKFYYEGYFVLIDDIGFTVKQIFAPYSDSEVVGLDTWKQVFYKQNLISEENQNVINNIIKKAQGE